MKGVDASVESADSAESTQRTVDVLVLGSGAAGLTAALVAAVEGLEVLLCEKSATLGGTTATSGGSLWVPGAAEVLAVTPQVDSAQARRYLEREIGPWLRPDLLDGFLEAGPEAIAYLKRHSEVCFVHATNPDYHADAPDGSATGHAILTKPFDGARLGADFALVRPPRSVFTVLGGMMVGRREIPDLVHPFRSWAALRSTIALLSQHARARLRHSRGTRLLMGNALVARYLVSLRKQRVQIAVNTRLVELHRQGHRVVGATLECAGQRQRIDVRVGIVLATGGIAHDKQLRSELMRDFPHDDSMACEENTGDGVRAARAVGAAVDTEVSGPAFWSPSSVRHHANGERTLWIHGHMDRGKPGLIAVNRAGQRFVNEANSYHDFVEAQYATGAVPAYLICDHRFVKRYGLGLIRPLVSCIALFVRDRYVKRADSIRELAVLTGIDPEGLCNTVEQVNVDARVGADRAFGRGMRVLNRFNGDPDHKPNPCVAPIEHGPFYALEVSPCSIGTTVGLHTDADSRVFDEDGAVIEGLYACGNDMTSVMRGFYPCPGATLGPAVVFAYRAARGLVAQAERTRTVAPAHALEKA